MEEASCSGQMGLAMKAIGDGTMPVEKENLFIHLATFMKAIGIMIKLMVLVSINQKMEESTMEVGETIPKMEKEEKYGKTVHILLAFILTALKKVLGSTVGQIVLLTKATGKIT